MVGGTPLLTIAEVESVGEFDFTPTHHVFGSTGGALVVGQEDVEHHRLTLMIGECQRNIVVDVVGGQLDIEGLHDGVIDHHINARNLFFLLNGEKQVALLRREAYKSVVVAQMLHPDGNIGRGWGSPHCSLQ